MAEVTARQELEEIADLYRQYDRDEKEAAEEKEKLKDAFMALVTEVVREEVPLATKTTLVPSDQDPREYVQKHHPGWIVISIEMASASSWKVTIQEDPDLVKYEFEVGGFKFGRTTSQKAKVFDAERLWHERPDLRHCVKTEEVTTYSLIDAKAAKAMVDDPSLKAVFDDYWTVEAPKPRMMPVSPIKEEDT